MENIFALIDCNNFYVSCERVFNPQYQGKAVVVLSNNDGCVIARSDEAKSLNIQGLLRPEPSLLRRFHAAGIFTSSLEHFGTR